MLFLLYWIEFLGYLYVISCQIIIRALGVEGEQRRFVDEICTCHHPQELHSRRLTLPILTRPREPENIVGPPRLPLDLERDIFELAAAICRPRIPIFILVAQRVRQWLEPMLYTTIIHYDFAIEPYALCPPVPSMYYTCRCCGWMKDRRRVKSYCFDKATAYAEHILLVQPILGLDETEKIIRNCINVKNLLLHNLDFYRLPLQANGIRSFNWSPSKA
ncbi:hypothetical protein CPB84DRAFT_820002 [Gymnopilus junonius]|uniref:Uncharacterized protein n=1 Tax=Gymnopilus junonius TaxID=109634 RepID=A0A9P5NN66_GYMJU|nr:hypothetical protein CPB84DRAFT_820002 [Gymnopilus junonius]